MRKQNFNKEDFTAYLLGDLPGAETELFDELSFTDDEFAGELKAAEKDLVDAYVNEELTGKTLEKFKSFYLASPLRREKVNFARTFQIYAKKSNLVQQSAAAAVVDAAAVTESKPKQTLAGFLAGLFAAPRPALQWGFAFATLALMFFGGWLLLENLRLRQEVSQTEASRRELLDREKQLQNEIGAERSVNLEKEEELSRVRDEITRLSQLREQERKRVAGLEQLEQTRRRAADQSPQRGSGPAPSRQAAPPRLSIASFILTPQLRSVNQIQTLSLPARTDYVAMQLELESDDYSAYRVALQSQADNLTLWRSAGGLKTRNMGEKKVLNVRFPAGLLKSGVYSLQVSGISAGGAVEIVSDYSFRVVSQ